MARSGNKWPNGATRAGPGAREGRLVAKNFGIKQQRGVDHRAGGASGRRVSGASSILWCFAVENCPSAAGKLAVPDLVRAFPACKQRSPSRRRPETQF